MSHLRLRSPTEEEVAAADSAPWDAPFSSAVRPVPYVVLRRASVATALLYLLGGSVALAQALNADRIPATHPTALAVIGIYAIATALFFGVLPYAAAPLRITRLAPSVIVINLVFGSFTPSAVTLAAGPSVTTWAAAYVEAPIFALYLLRRRWAALCTLFVAAEYAIVLRIQDGVTAPVVHWLVVVATVITMAVIIGGIAERADELAASERVARMELADVNRTLEDRVQTQVGELESLGRLRRFLSPQVADAVTSSGSDELLAPHRREIAVFFCDLRGFTSFTNQAEPEEVVRVLDEYYRTVGGVLQRHDATIGGYSGDGVMAYFGDPVPRQEPALDAVRMANELRGPLDALVVEWQRRGHALSYGIGLAYGYATLGVIGFDGRYDYTPLGSVVNLASRLCASALPAQVLLDSATQLTTSHLADTEHVLDLELKGFTSATRAYALVACQA
jgi:class 3 adenylate cyclase